MMTPARQYPQPLPRILVECAWFARSSRSLASLLPALFASGLLALLITAVTLLSLGMADSGFVSAWMESWAVAWPIAFPVAWLAFPRRGSATRTGGLGLGDVADVSQRVTARHGKTVLRGLQPAFPAQR
ncbi:MAG TPA: DUF2798 domain-containing protein [Noviherbaspirillum sp.]|jgi:hypothetical protein|uniref:DUF2798 domain-containing protein n=1 Tax=Noviherbaspirillum sp. TaxID=1926288 RepID=UPI002F923D0C